MPHTQTRAELLDSRPRYDTMRDSADALPIGTERPFVPYTGAHRDISLVDMTPDREMFLMRTEPERFPAWMVTIKTNARTRRAERLDMYDWDCHKCRTAVMTPDLPEPCPNCFL